jgi:hypothetical protein
VVPERSRRCSPHRARGELPTGAALTSSRQTRNRPRRVRAMDPAAATLTEPDSAVPDPSHGLSTARGTSRVHPRVLARASAARRNPNYLAVSRYFVSAVIERVPSSAVPRSLTSRKPPVRVRDRPLREPPAPARFSLPPRLRSSGPGCEWESITSPRRAWLPRPSLIRLIRSAGTCPRGTAPSEVMRQSRRAHLLHVSMNEGLVRSSGTPLASHRRAQPRSMRWRAGVAASRDYASIERDRACGRDQERIDL